MKTSRAFEWLPKSTRFAGGRAVHVHVHEHEHVHEHVDEHGSVHVDVNDKIFINSVNPGA